MDCPRGVRECPNEWTDCELCAYFRNKQCQYELMEPETEQTDPKILERAAQVAERSVKAEAIKSVEKIKGTWKGEWPEHFMSLNTDEALNEFYKHKTQDLHHKEPLPAGNGIPGGGGKNRRKKSKKGTKIPIEPWTSNV